MSGIFKGSSLIVRFCGNTNQRFPISVFNIDAENGGILMVYRCLSTCYY